jgi:3-methyladenine DNA glycosylase AlkD
MNIDQALAQIATFSTPQKAAQMADYHKAERRYYGTSNPEIDNLTKDWRAMLTLDARLALASDLWDSNVHEGRIAAAKLLTQARIRPDEAAWDLICAWVPEFDAWAISDSVCIAAQKRVMADLGRLDVLETWTTHPVMWVRRAALVSTLPLARLNNLKPQEAEARERALTWAEGYLPEKDWFMQKVVAWWLRDLSKHDANRTAQFLAEFGDLMKPWARKEASQYLP